MKLDDSSIAKPINFGPDLPRSLSLSASANSYLQHTTSIRSLKHSEPRPALNPAVPHPPTTSSPQPFLLPLLARRPSPTPTPRLARPPRVPLAAACPLHPPHPGHGVPRPLHHIHHELHVRVQQLEERRAAPQFRRVGVDVHQVTRPQAAVRPRGRRPREVERVDEAGGGAVLGPGAGQGRGRFLRGAQLQRPQGVAVAGRSGRRA